MDALDRYRQRRESTRLRRLAVPRPAHRLNELLAQPAVRWRAPGRSLLVSGLAVVGDLALLAVVAAKLALPPNAAFDALVFLFSPLLFFAVGYTIFLLWRYVRVKSWYIARARANPEARVPSAGSIISDVVGRDELCEILIENVRNRGTARPNIIEGGPGAGKTAVLVRLTKLLAERRAIPVTVSLRDVQRPPLNFGDLAYERFKSEVNQRLYSGGNADQVWRQLRRDNLVVVLADNLDEALIDPDLCADREGAINLGVREASQADLPLIIASRPHDPLRTLEAAITRLEPLGEGPALDYLTDGTQEVRRHQLTQLVQAADIADQPLYLQLIRDMEDLDLDPTEQRLTSILSGQLGGTHDRSAANRVVLRRGILDEWRRLLIEGHLYEDYALAPALRERTVSVLSALACIGLSRDNQQVDFADLVGPVDRPIDGPQAGDLGATLGRYLQDRWGRSTVGTGTTQRPPDESVLLEGRSTLERYCVSAATMGSELGIVDARERSVIFRHSTIQAYLGSRHLGRALENPGYVDEALRNCGNEFLMALAMMAATGDGDGSAWPPSLDLWTPPPDRGSLIRRFEEINPDPLKNLQMYAAIVEVDSMRRTTLRHGDIVREIAANWPRFCPTVEQDRSLLNARIKLVRHIGRAASLVLPRTSGPDERAYRSLFTIALAEPDRAVRVAAVRAMAAGRWAAVDDLNGHLDGWWQWWDRYWQDPRHSGDLMTEDAAAQHGRICAALAPLLYHPPTADDASQQCPDDLRSRQGELTEAALDNLRRWVRDYLPAVDPGHPGRRPWILLEAALARGFKIAANSRPGYGDEAWRATLVDEAEEALKNSRFWFAQLNLVQALTLLSLPADPGRPLAERGHGSDPHRLVEYWLSIAGTGHVAQPRGAGRAVHPFVREAGELAKQALATRQPERYCWLDEIDTAQQIGCLQRGSSQLYDFREWILPSVGWSALDERGRQLLGGVLLLLHLTGRGELEEDTRDGWSIGREEDRLARSDRLDLPPCLTSDPSPLDVTRTVGTAKVSDPGSNCQDDCPFRLCPYPPVGQLPYRSELSEGFCRDLYRNQRRANYARNIGKAEQARFWQGMAERVRPSRARGPAERLDGGRTRKRRRP